MAFLPSFEHDIFISYSHVDNLGEDEWVTRFHQALEVALAQRVGRFGVVKLWRDKRLEGDQLFDETISGAVGRSALFLAITSSGYLLSDYCRLELRSFHDKACAEPHGLQVKDRSRIYNVLLTRIPPARWPSEYGRISGFAFHDVDDRPEDGDEPGSPTDPGADKPRFKRQLNALANALHRMLESFKETLAQSQPQAQPQQPAPVALSEPAGPRVFVADVADPLASLRRRLVTELLRKGVAVESGVPPPYDPQGHASRVGQATRDALLSVHLLDELPGREIDGEPGQTYPRRQLALARGSARSQLIWVAKEFDAGRVEDEDYRASLAQLESGQRDGADYDFVRGSSTLLVPQIVEKLEQLQKSAGGGDATKGAVLLDTHLKDQLYALELGRMLVERNVQPYINPQEDDPNKNLDAFEERLRHVSSLVIVYGQVSESWVRHRLGVALQLSVIKNLPIKAFYVLLVPPVKAGAAMSFQLGPVAVQLIDNSASAVLDALSVAPFCGAAQR